MKPAEPEKECQSEHSHKVGFEPRVAGTTRSIERQSQSTDTPSESPDREQIPTDEEIAEKVKTEFQTWVQDHKSIEWNEKIKMDWKDVIIKLAIAEARKENSPGVSMKDNFTWNKMKEEVEEAERSRVLASVGKELDAHIQNARDVMRKAEAEQKDGWMKIVGNGMVRVEVLNLLKSAIEEMK
jgi:hypothetical protein